MIALDINPSLTRVPCILEPSLGPIHVSRRSILAAVANGTDGTREMQVVPAGGHAMSARRAWPEQNADGTMKRQSRH